MTYEIHLCWMNIAYRLSPVSEQERSTPDKHITTLLYYHITTLHILLFSVFYSLQLLFSVFRWNFEITLGYYSNVLEVYIFILMCELCVFCDLMFFFFWFFFRFVFFFYKFHCVFMLRFSMCCELVIKVPRIVKMKYDCLDWLSRNFHNHIHL